MLIVRYAIDFEQVTSMFNQETYSLLVNHLKKCILVGRKNQR